MDDKAERERDREAEVMSKMLLPVIVALTSCTGADDSSESVANVIVGVDPVLAYGIAVAAGLGGWFARKKWDERSRMGDDG